MADSSKTEKATPKKRRDERKKGNVFLSKDVISVATLAVSFFTFFLLAKTIAQGLGQVVTLAIDACGTLETDIATPLQDLKNQSIMVLLKACLMPLAVTVVAVVGTFAQTRLLVTSSLLKPKFSRINPLEGFKRLFSLKSLIEALKGTMKITLLLTIVYLCLKEMLDDSAGYLYTDIPSAAAQIMAVGKNMAMRVLLAFTVLSAADFMYQWWDFERQLRMSKQEIKEEYKQMEGDPQIKGKIKEAQRRMAQSRMMQNVPNADVVVRNPTHFAVALRYRPGQDNAPIVLAKGQDEMALRIVKVAQEHQVAIIENVPLARGLYASTELNQEIPPEFYSAVAEILVHIIRLDDAAAPKAPKIER